MNYKFFFTVETFDSFCINYCRTMEYNYDSNDSNFCSSKLKRASWCESVRQNFLKCMDYHLIYGGVPDH